MHLKALLAATPLLLGVPDATPATVPTPALARADAPVLPLRFGEVELPTGVRIHYAEQGEPGAGPTVLFLHGYSDSWFSWSRVLPLLPPEWHAIAIDQRGHGASSAPEGDYAMVTLARDALAFLDARGIPRAVVVAHSMGTFVAQQMVALAPGRLDALVLVDGSSRPAELPVVAEVRGATAGFGEVPEAFVREFQESTVHRPMPASFMDAVVKASLGVPGRVWREAAIGMATMEPVGTLERFDQPALLFWGNRDGLFPRAEQELLLSRLPRARLVVFPDVGHAPHWEMPERFVEVLVGWEGEGG